MGKILKFVLLSLERRKSISMSFLCLSSLPFKGWGIPVWILIGAVVVGLLYISFKKGDVIQQKVESLFKGKNKNKIKEDNSSNEQN